MCNSTVGFGSIKSYTLYEYNTQSSESRNFYINIPDCQIHANSFSRIGANLWNEIWNGLPLHIRETENLHNFTIN